MMKIKYLFPLLLIVFFSSCKKPENNIISFDKVEYYHSEFYKLPAPPSPNEDMDSFEVYYFDFVKEKDKINYTKLSQFGFVKTETNDDFSIKINDFFTDQTPLKYHPDYKCLNCFQDIVLFYNKGELAGIAKFDFKCDKAYFTSFQFNKNIQLKRNSLQYKPLFKL